MLSTIVVSISNIGGVIMAKIQKPDIFKLRKNELIEMYLSLNTDYQHTKHSLLVIKSSHKQVCYDRDLLASKNKALNERIQKAIVEYRKLKSLIPVKKSQAVSA
jgi:hypothetical protein